jgi:hypothetical protein
LTDQIENGKVTVKPPYLVMDGRRMIPDYDELVSKKYSYLAVGSMVMTPNERAAVAKKVKLKSVAV